MRVNCNVLRMSNASKRNGLLLPGRNGQRGGKLLRKVPMESVREEARSGLPPMHTQALTLSTCSKRARVWSTKDVIPCGRDLFLRVVVARMVKDRSSWEIMAGFCDLIMELHASKDREGEWDLYDSSAQKIKWSPASWRQVRGRPVFGCRSSGVRRKVLVRQPRCLSKRRPSGSSREWNPVLSSGLLQAKVNFWRTLCSTVGLAGMVQFDEVQSVAGSAGHILRAALSVFQ